MPIPLAYFLTWHCHGTWLHGSEKGSVDYGHTEYGTPLLSPDSRRHRLKREMFGAPVELNEPHRKCVQQTVREVCEYRNWFPLAIHLRMTHVHVIVKSTAIAEKTLADLKAYCTRRLRERCNFNPHNKVWSEHGSTKYLWNDDSILRAVDYVVHGQGGHLIPAPFVCDLL